jgi:hypothetical protein
MIMAMMMMVPVAGEIDAGVDVGFGAVEMTEDTEESAIMQGSQCFPADTKVLTPNGEINIQDIKPGDVVYSYDFDSESVVEENVERIHKNFTYNWVEIGIGDETIYATLSHPFWVESEQRWYRAEDLKAGMELLSQSGETVPILSVGIKKLVKPENTYNFEVSDEHNYFVGENAVLVHNGPAFIVTPNGTVFPVPAGAVGPSPLPSGASGFQLTGGAGGNGLNSRVTSLSFRDPNWNQGARASYYNASGQKVDPYTGRTIGNADPLAHIPCN